MRGFDKSRRNSVTELAQNDYEVANVQIQNRSTRVFMEIH